MRLERSSYYYRAHPRDNRALLIRLKELAAVRVRYGYRRVTILLRREGWTVNAKRVYRLYLQENLGVRTKARRKRAAHVRVPLTGHSYRDTPAFGFYTRIPTPPEGYWNRKEILGFWNDRFLRGQRPSVLQVRWNAVADDYVVENSPDLRTWVPAPAGASLGLGYYEIEVPIIQ